MFQYYLIIEFDYLKKEEKLKPNLASERIRKRRKKPKYRVSKRKESREENNKIETKNTIEKISATKSCFCF